MKYLIQLKPVDKFFFGGEITFEDNSSQSNYLVRSEKYPQQTSILGMLRYQILKQKNLLKETYSDKEKELVKDYIGEKSFSEDSLENNFGYIREISPVFICHTNDGKNTYHITSPKMKDPEFKKGNGKCSFNGIVREYIPYIEGYQSKLGFKNDDIMDRILKEVSQIGIKKSQNGTTDTDAFYKIFSYKMSKNYSYAFILDSDEKIEDDIVYLGAERSAFQMKVSDFSQDYKTLFSEYMKMNYILFMSDACVSPEIFQNCDFSVTDIISFRNIITQSGNYRFKKKESKSEKYNMIRRGSVLFYSSENQLTELKKSIEKTHLQKIGYNIINR